MGLRFRRRLRFGRAHRLVSQSMALARQSAARRERLETRCADDTRPSRRLKLSVR
jgi:hypothetical protein